MSLSFHTVALIGRYVDPLVAEAMVALAEQASAQGARVLIDAD